MLKDTRGLVIRRRKSKKDKQYHGQEKREGQTIPWPREKEKDRQYHGQEKKRRTDNTMANKGNNKITELRTIL